MKKLNIAHVAILALVLSALSCATLDRTAYRISGSVAATVDAAMKSWANYVVWSKSQPSIDQTVVYKQEQQVRLGYIQYQTCQKLVYDSRMAYTSDKAAGKTALESAVSSLQSSASSIVALINSFVPPKTP